ncbi:hypothetical protein YDYSY3_59940 [Paenibacillus chitinolyticus]|nr:hypothetical protein YDYSY3_59940 [Paenibacillus chitinolyticus]
MVQTTLAEAAGENGVDVAQSKNVTVWNLAIAGGGLAGGILLETLGVTSFPCIIYSLTLRINCSLASVGTRISIHKTLSDTKKSYP